MMLNPERVSLPDIDTDFSFYRRAEVIDYIVNKYGVDHVAKIGTYSTMSSKSILKNVGKVMDVNHNTINAWNKEIPSSNGNVMRLSEAIQEIPAIITAAQQYPLLFQQALDLESMPKSAGVHPCFTGDTLIQTARGVMPIRSISIDDMVLTHNNRYKRVLDLSITLTTQLYRLVMAKTEEVKTTKDHPFLTKEKDTGDVAWLVAGELTPNHLLATYSDDEYDPAFYWQEVLSIKIEDADETVYNLSVQDDESYIAGNLVCHNCGLQISPIPLAENIPLMRDKKGETVTQYEGEALESLG